jgi:hypothetical protein
MEHTRQAKPPTFQPIGTNGTEPLGKLLIVNGVALVKKARQQLSNRSGFGGLGPAASCGHQQALFKSGNVQRHLLSSPCVLL